MTYDGYRSKKDPRLKVLIDEETIMRKRPKSEIAHCRPIENIRGNSNTTQIVFKGIPREIDKKNWRV